MNDYQATYVRVDSAGDVAVARFTVDSLSDEENIEQLGRELAILVENDGWRKLVLSMQGVRYVTSSALGKLISLHRKLHRNEGRLVICDVGEEVSGIMAASRLNRYFCFADTVEAARNFLQNE